MDEEATIEINGKKAVSSDEPIVIQELDENNSIVVEVSAKNGAFSILKNRDSYIAYL